MLFRSGAFFGSMAKAAKALKAGFSTPAAYTAATTASESAKEVVKALLDE